MGNFAENLNLGNRFRPPLTYKKSWKAPSRYILTQNINFYEDAISDSYRTFKFLYFDLTYTYLDTTLHQNAWKSEKWCIQGEK